MSGGPSTIDIWDLKPGASTGGEFKPISTAGDVQISEHMPLTAKVMDKLSIVRSMSTREADHTAAATTCTPAMCRTRTSSTPVTARSSRMS